eukprot:3534433-Rhodomonas_salina.2
MVRQCPGSAERARRRVPMCMVPKLHSKISSAVFSYLSAPESVSAQLWKEHDGARRGGVEIA